MHSLVAAVTAHDEHIHYRHDDGDDRKDNEERLCVRVRYGAEDDAERDVTHARCSNEAFPGMVLDRNAVMPGEQPRREQGIESYAN